MPKKPVKLYFVRHGQTKFNVEKRLQGHADSPLTENGIMQAKAVGRGLEHIHFKAAYASDSPRVISTAKHVIDTRDIPLTTDPRLKEMCFGVFESQVIPEIKGDDGELLKRIFSLEDLHLAAPQGETFMEVFARTKAAIDDVITRHHDDGGNILIFSHGVTIGNYLMQAYKLSQYPKLENCSVSVVSHYAGQSNLDMLADTSFRETGSKLLY
ncbi:histidine phosphatase family protein [Bacillus marasmi]|uniref:histidine phosphatase family protein n=1 Tax=Bacillus marasmi TaxID=1926279 RepID=UPI00164E91B7|nr:histidine phosphatase family protein [Bacillus marasmi]